jgi:hypothetical protein
MNMKHSKTVDTKESKRIITKVQRNKKKETLIPRASPTAPENMTLSMLGRMVEAMGAGIDLSFDNITSEKFNAMLPKLRARVAAAFGVDSLPVKKFTPEEYQKIGWGNFLLSVVLGGENEVDLKKELTKQIKALTLLKTKVPQKRRVKSPNVLLAIKMRKKHKNWVTIRRTIFPDWLQMEDKERRTMFRKFKANVRSHMVNKNTLSSKK